MLRVLPIFAAVDFANASYAALMLLAAARDEPFLENSQDFMTYWALCLRLALKANCSVLALMPRIRGQTASRVATELSDKYMQQTARSSIIRRCLEQTHSLVAVDMGGPD